MNIPEQYATTRLNPPITIRANWKLHFLLWGGGALLLAACVFALFAGDDYKIQIVAAIGIPFFGLCLIFGGAGVWRGQKRGLVAFSEQGIWLSALGVEFPWKIVGPAWVMHIKHAGGESHEVFFVVRNVSLHTSELDFVGKLFLRIAKKSLSVGKGGVVDWGLNAFLSLGGDSHSFDELASNMEEMRDRMSNDDDAFAMSIPTPYRIGVPPEQIVALINSEILLRANDHGGTV